jgi:molybdate transport system permease protein
MPSTWFGLEAQDWQAVLLSVQITTTGVVLSLPLGIALGWLLARRQFPAKWAVEAAVNLPLVLPPVVTGYLLMVLLGRRGVLGAWLLQWFGLEIALTWRAAVIAVAVMGFPLLVRSVRLAIQAIDPRLTLAARSLGAGPLDAFFTISLPLARNGVLAGMVLAFARGLGEFGATLIFAGNMVGTRTLAVQFYNVLEEPAAEQRLPYLVVVAALLACAALATSEYLERRGQRAAA